MKSDRKSLASNVSWLLVVQIANYALPLALLPFLTRTLGVEAFGLLAFVQAYTMYFILLTEYGFNLSASRLISSSRNDRAAVAQIFWATFWARSFIGAFSIVILVGLVFSLPVLNENAFLYLVSGVTVVGSVMVPQWYFQGQELIKPLAWTQLLVRLATTVVTFVLVRESSDVVLVLMVQGIGSILVGIVCWLLIWKFAPVARCQVGVHDILLALRSGWYVFLSSAAISLYTNSNVFFLGLVASSREVAYFSIAEKIARAASGFIGPVQQAVYPRVAMLATAARAEAFKLLRRVLLGLSGIGACVFLGILIFSEFFIGAFAGPGWQEASESVMWLSLVPLAVAVSSVLGTLIMLNFGLDRHFARIVVGAGLVNLGLMAGFSASWGATGASIALMVTEVGIVISFALTLRASGLLSCVAYGREEAGASVVHRMGP